MLHWVKMWVASMAILNEKFRNDDGAIDFEALGREEYAFRRAIITGDLSTNERAAEVYKASEAEFNARSEAGRKNIAKRWNQDSVEAPTRKDGGAQVDVSTSTDSKPLKNKYGQFQNVLLSDDEFEKWSTHDNAEGLLDELSCFLASSGKKYKSHYATLLNWERRRKAEEAPKKKFKTMEDISRENYEKSLAMLEEMESRRKHG